MCNSEFADQPRSSPVYSVALCEGISRGILTEKRATSDVKGKARLSNLKGSRTGTVETKVPASKSGVSPYPLGWDSQFSRNGNSYYIRPIKPGDIGLYPAFLAKISSDDIRQRFLVARKIFPQEELRRFTQLDYDFNMAFVALKGNGHLVGVGRLSCDPDHEKCECALLVRTDLQGNGIGWQLFERIVTYAKAKRFRRIEGFVLEENMATIRMCRKFGFSIRHHPWEPGIMVVALQIG